MTMVRATERGYFGGAIRELGDKFDVPDDLWDDERRRPRWAEEVGTSTVSTVEAGDDPPPDDRTKKPRGNGVVEALGGPRPDWVPKAAMK